MKLSKLSVLALAVSAMLAACGGGGDSSTPTPTPKFAAPSTLANICTTADAQKSWVRSYLNDVYLWYQEIVDVPVANYATPETYFDALLVKSKDRFSFTMDQAAADAYFASGTDVGFGATWVQDANSNLRISYSEPNSPAAAAGLGRGATIVAVNGVAVNLAVAAPQSLLDALYPTTVGQLTQMDVIDLGASASRSVTMSAQAVVQVPVPQATVITTSDQKKVGYLVFNEHIATAGPQLNTALTTFKSAAIDDLVLDMRYNGGGYIYIAQELASMIAGASVEGKLVEKIEHNDKHASEDFSFNFITKDNNNAGNPMPMLGLKRVFVLTGKGTCSASEAVINALTPFVQVITIGGTSCGKPYGFEQTNNCATAYFGISFAGVNNAGQSVPTTGIAPTCGAADDLDHALGGSGERLLSTALAYRASGACPATSFAQSLNVDIGTEGVKELWRSPLRDNMRLK